jgi:hypothetical protein
MDSAMERSFDTIDCAMSIADELELITVIWFCSSSSSGCLSGSVEIYLQNLLLFIHYRIGAIGRNWQNFTAFGKKLPLVDYYFDRLCRWPRLTCVNLCDLSQKHATVTIDTLHPMVYRVLSEQNKHVSSFLIGLSKHGSAGKRYYL